MSSSTGRLPGLTVLALCLSATAPPIMTARAGTPAPAAAALQDFETEADFYEGLDGARLDRSDRNDRNDRGDRGGLRLAAGSPAIALRPAVFARRVVSTINVTAATDRPITCKFKIASGGLWDFTYEATIRNPNDVVIAFGENWVNSKSRMTGTLTTTLTDPIVPGTYRCTIGWDAFNESTGQMFTLPPTTVPLSISQ
jgi:hypothetical protein